MSLTIFYSYLTGAEHTFHTTGDEVVIGRPVYEPVQLDLSPDPNVSRLHAHLFYSLGTGGLRI